MKSLQLAIRALLKFRFYIGINIIGLGLSLACCILLFRYIHSELTTDQCFSDSKQLYITTKQQPVQNRPEIFPGYVPFINLPIAPLKDPDVEIATNFVSLPEATVSLNERIYNVHALAVDTLFLEVLDYPVTGESSTILFRDPAGTVITRGLTKRLFGNDDPLGKTVMYMEHTLTVKGVIEEPATKTSIRFDILLSQGLQWHWPPIQNASITRMHPHADIGQVNEHLKQEDPEWIFQFFPLTALYLDKSIDKENSMFTSGNKQYLLILGFINILILLIGIFNFINIYTVIILRRSKELGLKKVFGVNLRQIFFQLYFENLLQIAVAVFIGWTMIEVTKGWFTSWLDIFYSVNHRFDLFLSMGLLFLLPLLTALFLTRQLYLLTHTDPGYQQENILKTQFFRSESKMYYTDEEIAMHEQTKNLIRQRMEGSPLFEAWTFGITPNDYPDNNLTVNSNADNHITVTHMFTTENYFPLLDIQVREGRLWEAGKDYPGALHMIINETAQKMLGITDIDQQVIQPGQQLYYSEEGDIHDQNPPYRIIGVIEDFQPKHLTNDPVPMVFTYGESQWTSSNTINRVIARHIPGKRQEAILFLKSLFEETISGEFEYSLLADEVQSLYNDDKKVSNIYLLFSCMVLIISSMGLFSISLFDIQNKYKPIAIHKINGATGEQLLKLLGKKYLILLTVAFIISVPLTFIGIIKYMENIIKGTGITWWIFPLAFIITGLISWGTLWYQLKKAVRMNPVDAIRSE